MDNDARFNFFYPRQREPTNAPSEVRADHILSALEKLPTELMTEILEYLCPGTGSTSEERRKSTHILAVLCRTSKELQKKAIPFLCRVFTNHKNDYQIPRFTKTICTYPDIAQQLRRVELLGSSSTSLFSLSNAELDLFCDKLREKMKDSNIFYRMAGALTCRCFTAQLLILLSVATEIRSLKFSTESKYMLEPLGTCSQCQHNIFQWVSALFWEEKACEAYGKLTDVVIRGSDTLEDDGTDMVDHGQVLPLLHLPALRKFEAFGLHNGDTRTLRWSPPASSTTLEEIHLDEADLDTSAFEDILNCTQALRVLGVSWSVRTPLEDGEDEDDFEFDIDPPALLDSLLPFENQLQDLMLTNLPQNGIFFESKPALGSLLPFTQLRTLVLDEYLLGEGEDTTWEEVDLSDYLPQTLETVVIHTCTSRDSDLADICAAFGGVQLDNLANLQITFEELRCANLLVRRQTVFNANDFGVFKRDYFGPNDTDERVAFSAWARDMALPPLLAKFADLVVGDGNVMPYMFKKQAAVSLDGRGNVFVHGVGEAEEEYAQELKPDAEGQESEDEGWEDEDSEGEDSEGDDSEDGDLEDE